MTLIVPFGRVGHQYPEQVSTRYRMTVCQAGQQATHYALPFQPGKICTLMFLARQVSQQQTQQAKRGIPLLTLLLARSGM